LHTMAVARFSGGGAVGAPHHRVVVHPEAVTAT
jgi:hypothetical protein